MTNNPSFLQQLQQRIEPLRQQIIHHPTYNAITELPHLRVFMQYHVFAVWDFMSLLKSLQRNLTCTTVPWFPVGSADTRFLINEIVVGEESDVDAQGVRKSHFELYLEAMEQAGSDTATIQQFSNLLQAGNDLSQAFTQAEVPAEAQQFVGHTFALIKEAPVHVQAAVFTFGREDLIPGMFHTLVTDLQARFPGSVSTFKYYLERHIEVDGDHHSQLALQMTSELCDNDPQKWQGAERAVVASLEKRIELWNGVLRAIEKETKEKAPAENRRVVSN